jgi:ubiquinol oxidase
LNNIKIVHKERVGFGDKVAAFMVAVARTGFDIATRYPKHHQRFPRLKGSESNMVKVGLPKEEENHNKSVALAKGQSVQSSELDLPEEMSLSEMRKRRLCFTPEAWLVRIVFLESIAGVPGMVAATVRHLQSLRLLRRDKGWVKSLLEDAMNERTHLLVALKLYKPRLFMRTMLLLSQGIFYNFFFLFYLVAPRVAHRFVGYLEEEAVVTYSRICDDIVEGRLPEWQHYPAPHIAIDYWGLKPDAKMLDVMRSIRADEANHRQIHHTLANLKADDFNPFAYGDAPAATRGMTWGFTREEAIQYFEQQDAKRRQALQIDVQRDDKGPFQGREGNPV